MAGTKSKVQWKKVWDSIRIRGVATYALSITGAFVFVGLTVWAFQQVLATRAIHHANEDLKKGFAALAADRLESYRRTLASSENGCRTLVNAYYEARNAQRLQWASEACLDNGIDIPEPHLGLSASKEMVGMDGDAIRVLNNAANKFRESPDFHFRMAQIFRRRQNAPAATTAYLEAARRAPANEKLSFEALEFFSQSKDWPNARKMAENLRNAKTDSPEVKLMIAQALKHGGDAAGAKSLVDQARTLLASQPADYQEAVKATFGELLEDAPRVPASEAPASQTPRSKRAKKR